MDSRMQNLVFQSLKRKAQLGATIKDAGAHMYHAATGVADGGEVGSKKRAKLKKAFSRYRGMSGTDEGLHSYALDMEQKRFQKGT